MLYHHSKDNGALEGVVRKLLLLQPRPTLCFVTVPLWCKCRPFCRVSAPFGIKKLPNYNYTLLDDRHRATTHSESAVIERTLEALCIRYGLTCLSLCVSGVRTLYSLGPLGPWDNNCLLRSPLLCACMCPPLERSCFYLDVREIED